MTDCVINLRYRLQTKCFYETRYRTGLGQITWKKRKKEKARTFDNLIATFNKQAYESTSDLQIHDEL